MFIFNLKNRVLISSLLLVLLVSLFFASYSYSAIVIPQLTSKFAKDNKIKHPAKMDTSKDDRFMAMSMDDGASITIWDMEKGESVAKIDTKKMQPTDINLDSNRKKLYVLDAQGKLYVRPLASGTEFTHLAEVQQQHQFKFIRANADSLALATKNPHVIVIDKDSLKIRAQVKLKSEIKAIDIASLSNRVVVATADEKMHVFKYLENEPELYLSKSMPAPKDVASVLINADGKGVVAMSADGSYATSCAPCIATGFKTPASPSGSGADAGKAATMSLSGNTLNVLTKDNVVVRKDIVTGKVTGMVKIDPPTTDVLKFYKEGKYLLAGESEGGVALTDIDSNSRNAKLIATKSGWIVMDEMGRFDGDESSFKDISWNVDGKLVTLDQLADKYFEPGLLKKLQDKGIPMLTNPKVSIGKGMHSPPEVTVQVLSSEAGYSLPNKIDLKITAQVADPGDQMKDLKIFHNGKVVPEADYTLVKANPEAKGGKQEWSVKLIPVEGKNNFTVQISGWEDIIGFSQAVSFNAPKSDKIAATRQFMRSIGINDYQGKELDLDFAIADAKGIFESFKQFAKADQDAKITTLMLNEQASRDNIRALLKDTIATSNKDDMLVLFMSGHGMVVNDDWYFLPQEAKTLKDPKHVSSVGLSAKELMDNFVNLRSQKIVMIIDACQSGAAAEDFNNFHQRRALKGLSSNTGIHILAATRADQQAPEFGELGHGLFTYTLMKGMKKNFQGNYNADQWPQDGKLTISELQRYGQKNVPAVAHAMSEKYFKASSARGGLDETTIVTPIGSSQGQDFVIGQ